MADVIKTAADIKRLTSGKVIIPWTMPETGDVVYIPNPTKSFYLLVENADDTNTPILTIETPSTVDDLEVTVDDYEYTCAVSELVQLGPFSTALFSTASDHATSPNSVKITLSGTFVTGELKLAMIAV